MFDDGLFLPRLYFQILQTRAHMLRLLPTGERMLSQEGLTPSPSGGGVALLGTASTVLITPYLLYWVSALCFENIVSLLLFLPERPERPRVSPAPALRLVSTGGLFLYPGLAPRSWFSLCQASMQLVRRFRATDLGKHLTRTCVLTVTQKSHAEALPPPAMPRCGHPRGPAEQGWHGSHPGGSETAC